MPQIEIVGFKESLAIALEGIAIDVQESLKDKLTKQHGKDTGAGQSSIMARSDGQVITINMAEHLKYLEYGTPPHFPPPEALEGWVMRKWGATSIKERKAKAYILARHISKFGTRPFPFIRQTFNNDVLPIIKTNLKSAFR